MHGERILIRSDNMDVLAQGFIDANKLYVALNNLDDFEQPINLNFNGSLPDISELKIKSLIVNPNTSAEYTTQNYTERPETYLLKKNETVVIEFTFLEPIMSENLIQKQRYYSVNHMQPIQANNSINYNFSNINLTGDSGFATLSMSIGRKHDRSKSPNIIVNGVSINVPSNWKGYDQSERDDFFGTIEIPVPIGIIQENNTVSITFDDSDGYLSSLVLTIETYDSSILGIDSNQTNIKNIKLYPNPTTGKLNILNAEINSLISIYSTSGVRVFTGKYKGFPINLEQLTDGLYFIKINNTTLKVIIKH